MSVIDDVRSQLLAGEYTPIPVSGKQVFLPRWQKCNSTPVVVRSWSKPFSPFRGATNTGILTRLTPAFDIDILLDEPAEAVEALVRNARLVRIGQAPKRAILFRTDKPFQKIRVEFIAPDGSEQKLEMLGDGQQVVVHGIHPDTRQPYRWIGGTPWEIERAKLPLITKEKAQRLVDAAAGMLVKRFGFKIGRRSNGHDGTNHDEVADRFMRYGAPDIHTVVRKLRLIDPDCDYRTWFEIACVLFNSLGDEVGFLVFDAWSRHGIKYDVGKISPLWLSIRRANGYGYHFGTIVHYSKVM